MEDPAAHAARAVPFATEYVLLTKQEHIHLKMEAASWRSLHSRAVKRLQQQAEHDRRVLLRHQALAAQREAALKDEVARAEAQVRDLRQRLFGRKSEQRKLSERQAQGPGECAPVGRGQRRGAAGHGRTCLPDLPARDEVVEMAEPQCPRCRLGLVDFPGTQDSEVVEIEVQAYRRVIRRRRYRPVCQCGCLPGIVTAPAPAQLIPRGKFGVSVWTQVLLDKFLYGRPSHRLLQDLCDHGLKMAPGTLAGGLKKITPLFEPLYEALATHLRSQTQWHADETRWMVFAKVEGKVEGKVGHRGYLWVFLSADVVYYVVDDSRSAEVIEKVLAGVTRGVIICDRYSAYKKFARLHPGVLLAFCWAHQRRDFLELENSYPELSAWAQGWVRAIAELYRLNAQRVQALAEHGQAPAQQAQVEQAVQAMAERRVAALADPSLAEPAAKVLRSMAVHWSGLTVFVARPEVPMDNNPAERAERHGAVGRKGFYGSGAEWSGELVAMMYSLLMTMRLWQINARTWLNAYLHACAENGGKAPGDIDAFLPWRMDAARLAALRASPPPPSGAGEPGAIDSS
jgi:transposase